MNQAQEYVALSSPFEWRLRTYYFTTVDNYNTGTIAVTQNSRTVTGTGTTWTVDVAQAYLIVNSHLYKIYRRASNTSIILEAPIAEATASGLSYEIVWITYPVPHTFASIVSVVHEGTELEPLTKSQLLTNDGLGAPVAFALVERSWEDYYTTGTLATTIDSAAVTGSSTVWTDRMQNMNLRINNEGDLYVVKERTSDTAITLDRPYTGSTASSLAYAIGPAGQSLMQISHYPDDNYFLKVEGLIVPPLLVRPNDLSIIPNHEPLIRGALWLALHDLENVSAQRIQLAQAQFERSLKLLRDQYRIVKNLRWTDERELVARRATSATQFNPLDRRSFR